MREWLEEKKVSLIFRQAVVFFNFLCKTNEVRNVGYYTSRSLIPSAHPTESVKCAGLLCSSYLGN
jgi:hypothetical protein